MKIEVNVSKRKFLIIFFGILLSVGGVLVTAAFNPGHVGSEIDFGSINGQDIDHVRNIYMKGLVREVDIGGTETGDYFGFSNQESIVFRAGDRNRLEIDDESGEVRVSSSLCLNGQCRSSWGGAGGGGGNVVSLSYTGDGSSNRPFNSGFRPKMVMVFQGAPTEQGSPVYYVKTDSVAGSRNYHFGGNGLNGAADSITIDDNGFTIVDEQANQNQIIYHYVAIG